MQKELGIRIALECVALCLQSGPQRAIVVDLAVESNDQPAVCSLHRLRAARRQIDNRETAMPEADAAIGGVPLTTTVRTARSHVVAHANKFVPIHGSCSRAVGVDARNAAHIKYRSVCEKLGSSSVDILDRQLICIGPSLVLGGGQREHANGSSPKIQQFRSLAIAQHPKAAIDL